LLCRYPSPDQSGRFAPAPRGTRRQGAGVVPSGRIAHMRTRSAAIISTSHRLAARTGRPFLALVAIALCLGALNARCNTTKAPPPLSGQVVENGSVAPVDGALVRAMGHTEQTYSDGSGNWSLDVTLGQKDENVTVEASKPGFPSVQQSAYAARGTAVTVPT